MPNHGFLKSFGSGADVAGMAGQAGRIALRGEERTSVESGTTFLDSPRTSVDKDDEESAPLLDRAFEPVSAIFADAEAQNEPEHCPTRKSRCCRLFKRCSKDRKRRCCTSGLSLKSLRNTSPRWVIVWLILVGVLVWGMVVGIQGLCRMIRHLKRRPNDFDHAWRFDDRFFYHPTFNDSRVLNCPLYPANGVYKDGPITLVAPVGTAEQDHTFDLRGPAVGTLTLASNPDPEVTDVMYDVLITGEPSRLAEVKISYPDVDKDGDVAHSHLNITTPSGLDANSQRNTGLKSWTWRSCMRYEITLYVPQNLKKLRVITHAVTHVAFATTSHINLQDLTLSINDAEPRGWANYDSLIVPHESLHADKLSIITESAWIIGGVSAMDETIIKNRNGRTKLNVFQGPPKNFDQPEPAVLKTYTSNGLTEVNYNSQGGYRKRPIRSTHTTYRSGNLNLFYGEADFNGRLRLDTPMALPGPIGSLRYERPDGDNYDEDSEAWTNSYGNQDGGDEMIVRSNQKVYMFMIRGWRGLIDSVVGKENVYKSMRW
ncbi:hypothetical protein B0H34DRAFT_677217 [Crassisporium funariophilum]|nr:hypothetical protein B0H34DRAFT_677217 [Crassisporium funariophilum]